MAENPTFGCGTFLPGEGPGNFPGFTGGGTIDSGGGNGDPDPPDPPAPPGDIGDPIVLGEGGGTGPAPGVPNVAGICKCKITNTVVDEPVISGPVQVKVITITMTQECQETTPGAAANAITQHNTTQINNALATTPAANPGNWSLVGSDVQGTAGANCKDGLTGLCGLSCATIVVTLTFERKEGGGSTPRPDAEEGDGLTGVGDEPGGGGGGSTPIDDQEEGGGLVLFGGDEPGGGGGGATPIGDQEEGGGLVIFGGDEPGGGGGGTSLGGDFGVAGGQLVEGGTNTDGTQLSDPVGTANSSNFGGENPDGAGNQATSLAGPREQDLVTNAITTGELDLNNAALVDAILRKKPNGIEDGIIAFNRTPERPKLVKNDTGFTELFNEFIDSNIYYILKNKNNTGNWDSTRAAGVTPTTVYESLKPEIQQLLNNIRNYDGTRLTRGQIFSMIGSRILDGSIGRINTRFLQDLAQDSQKRIPVTINRSSVDKVNEVAALALIDKNKFSLDPAASTSRESNLLKNWKVLSSDIDKYLPVTIEGITRRYYINDDDTFINRSTLSINDGDYFDIKVGGESQRLFAESEKDHAFLIPETTRQKAISLLGGNPGRILDVSANSEDSKIIEEVYSLTDSRQPFYVLSGDLETLVTKPSDSGSFLLKDSTMRYNLMDTTTEAGLAEVNEFIKYKANKRIFVLDYDDLIIDYVETVSHLHLTQTDIIFDSPKTNKTIPLLVRQLPFYIMIYPTNRTEFNIFNDKSQIQEIGINGETSRRLRCSTNINPEFTRSQTNKFIRYTTDGRNARDVLGNPDTQARISVINPNDPIFNQAYRQKGQLTSSAEYTVNRPRTGFRLLREIIRELDTNYELSINGVGKTLTEFDVFSRLNLRQFNILSRTENFGEINRAVRNGLINNVKLIPPVSRSDNRIVINKTQLVQRKSTAGTDTFKQIKATNDGQNIVSPDEEGRGGFTPAG
jgi:hypothetical protein